ncbi:laminin B domain-containing protein [Spirosoma utsteinense]|uniref:Laminin IV type A domain-containing protein n=1 Tax=Spirosoma utsteinense TaxID=2585773 RepID=A0ABR6WDP8_9BACT|nr:laminin B domain-containing protein [Spirosoma utsteinense]MBC3788257.1 hypothetical protein [Spirosoma utsteinense]MBC3794670.1 hypothetical protein [Spirosoma utsteinense]
MGFSVEKVVFCRLVCVLGLLVAVLAGCSPLSIQQQPQTNSNNFDTDMQGWGVSEGGIGSFSATGGHPGGYLAGEDRTTGDWYYIASPAFLDVVRGGYGKTLRFELKQSAIDSVYSVPDDVILTDGTTTLTVDNAYSPARTWTYYAVRLDELSGWKKGKSAATRAEIRAVLQNLTALWIRGEFRGGPDQGGLDNVAVY